MGASSRRSFWSTQDLLEIKGHGSASHVELGEEESKGMPGVLAVSPPTVDSGVW